MSGRISQRTNDSGVDIKEPKSAILVVDTRSSMGLLTEALNHSSINMPSCDSEKESDGPKLSTSATTNTRQVIEKAKLIAISANKEWIAYVSVIPGLSIEGVSIKLTVHRLDLKENALWPLNPIISGDINSSLDHDFEHSISFLSVSSKGDLASISYMRDDKKQTYTTSQPKCFIFRVEEERGIVHEKSIEFQGRAVFLSNDKLALVNEKILKIYDCQDGYSLVKWFDLDPIFEDLHHPGSPNSLEPAFLTSKSSMINTPDHQQVASASNILQITKLIQHNMIVATYKFEGTRIWALDRNGIRITSFNSPRPVNGNILNVSSDKKLAASFVKSTLSINVYHVKTGLQAFQLKSLLGNEFRNSLNYDKRIVKLDESSNIALINYIQFCSRTQYLFHISVYELKFDEGSNNAMIIFEVWNIEAEMSIYVKTEKIRVDWQAKNSMIEPFVVEARSLSGIPVFTAIYTSLLEAGRCEFKSMNLTVFGNETMNTWKIKSANSPPTNVSINNLIYEFNQNLYDSNHLISLVASDEQDCNFIYLLRFGMSTVQLWRIRQDKEETEKILDEDQLVYIRAFKPPFYHFNEAFSEKWIRNDRYKEKLPINAITPSIDNIDQNSSSTLANQNVYRLGEHGIRLVEFNRLVVSICHPKRHSLTETEKITDHEWLEEVYLPVHNTKVANGEPVDKFTLKDGHFIQSVCQALHLLYTIYNDSREKLEVFGREILNVSVMIFIIALKLLTTA
ncbi:hypothetical protein MAM1_0030c02347 [Mucor ambiguus]|uniref:Uncharacterized protein n=1 Tax=Mucor ambiguus TaxID=91626 RepID=A0A0C9MIJ6_9FUNG|nr:hypothetical protein MAM1_0030c02347 [Mucor ambiguus]